MRPVTASEPKGVLYPEVARRAITLDRVLPSPALAPFVEHYWHVSWDLEGKPSHTQRVIGYPCVHLVFDRAEPGVFGVTRGAFVAHLSGKGAVLGVRFRPGAFHAWLGADVATITDQVVPFARWLGGDDAMLTDDVLSRETVAARIQRAEELLLPACPSPDPQVDLLHSIVARVETDSSIRTAEDLARVAGIGLRSLQRLFRSHVGVSPKWVVQRARLQEAASRLARGDQIDLAALAVELGYFDQAHMTRDFTSLVGSPPATYQSASRRE